jgi:hypothetical protein
MGTPSQCSAFGRGGCRPLCRNSTTATSERICCSGSRFVQTWAAPHAQTLVFARIVDKASTHRVDQPSEGEDIALRCRAGSLFRVQIGDELPGHPSGAIVREDRSVKACANDGAQTDVRDASVIVVVDEDVCLKAITVQNNVWIWRVERAYEFEVAVNQEQRVQILQGLRDVSKLR